MRSVLVAAVLATACALSHAQASIDSLSQCLAENTTGKDRKELARWVFFAMAAHPEIKQYTSDSLAAASDEVHRGMANTFTRLLADTCTQQTRAAFRQGGGKAIELAFQTLGKLAMQELMTNPEVSGNMARFERHLDQSKLKKVLGGD